MKYGSQMLYRRDNAPLVSIAPGALDNSDGLTVSGRSLQTRIRHGPLCTGLEDLDKLIRVASEVCHAGG